VGYKFSLVLSREITEEETVTLQSSGCAEAVFTTDSLPTNAEVTVTRLDFDDTGSPSLAEAIDAGLAAVRDVPDLSVPGLIVPAQPAEAQAQEAGEIGAVADEEPADASADSHAPADLVDAAAQAE
jgi:hypothetical protein